MSLESGTFSKRGRIVFVNVSLSNASPAWARSHSVRASARSRCVSLSFALAVGVVDLVETEGWLKEYDLPFRIKAWSTRASCDVPKATRSHRAIPT